MKRICFLAAALFWAVVCVWGQTAVYVAVDGDDGWNGTVEKPFRTFGRAMQAVLESDATGADVVFRGGRYNFEETQVVTAQALGGKRLRIRAYDNEEVIFGSFRTLDLKWKKDKDGIWKSRCVIPVNRLYADGKKRTLARYPNEVPGRLFGGTSEDALSVGRIRSWKNPVGGLVHTMHFAMWGSQHYRITGRIGDSLLMEGGYQLSRPSEIHPKLRYVENIREELDTLGEWFWSGQEKMLYYKPLEDENVDSVRFETTALPVLVSFEGTPDCPVRNVTVEGIVFTGTDRTVMEPYESLMRSDWGIYRGGALKFVNSEDCKVSGCRFGDLGGNALFIDKYACRDSVVSNIVSGIGGSAVCIVGDCSALRSPSFGYDSFVPFSDLDRVPGPANGLYPRMCLVEDNLIHDLGLVEKQVAGVEIQAAAMITVRHNSIYDVPRAGINIGDGAFGGHVIEFNDVFNTVLETGDHGAFNSWGRDRYWLPSYGDMSSLAEEHPETVLLDAVYTTVIRYNRFRCDHGWDIDLDDGSSNYHIYGNLCLSGGIKLREGFFRKVENNITVNNSFHPHVWFPHSHDVVRRNLFMHEYYPIAMNGWGDQLDFNFYSTDDALEKAREMGVDRNGASASLEFADPENGDYTVKPDCKALFGVGFENIPMTEFGVRSGKLKALAKKPDFPLVK